VSSTLFSHKETDLVFLNVLFDKRPDLSSSTCSQYKKYNCPDHKSGTAGLMGGTGGKGGNAGKPGMVNFFRKSGTVNFCFLTLFLSLKKGRN